MMIFPKNNKIRYSQDFAVFEGLPSDVNFDVVLLNKSGDKVKLVAPGYGGTPYGNGPIFLTRGFSDAKG